MFRSTVTIPTLMAAFLIGGCATTTSGPSKPDKVFAPLFADIGDAKTSKTNVTQTAQSGDYVFYQRILPEDVVAIDTGVSYKGRNHMMGILAPKSTYTINKDDLFYKTTNTMPGSLYCRMNDEKFFKICVSDDDDDGDFDRAFGMAVNPNKQSTGIPYHSGSLFEPFIFDTPITYRKTDPNPEIYLGILYRKGKTRPKFFARIVTESGQEIASAYGVIRPEKGEILPYVVNYGDARIEILSIDEGVLSYRILSQLSKGSAMIIN